MTVIKKISLKFFDLIVAIGEARYEARRKNNLLNRYY